MANARHAETCDVWKRLTLAEVLAIEAPPLPGVAPGVLRLHPYTP